MDGLLIALGSFSAALAFAAYQAWRNQNEKRDVAFLAAVASISGVSVAAAAIV